MAILKRVALSTRNKSNYMKPRDFRSQDTSRILALSTVSSFDYINVKSSSKKVVPRKFLLFHKKSQSFITVHLN